MAKKNNIFSEASRLRKQHPRKFKEYQQYVDWATELHAKKSKKRVGKKSMPKKKKVGAARAFKIKKLDVYKDHPHGVREHYNPSAIKKYGRYEKIGSVAFHKSQARKQLEEQLAWLLLSRDQAKTKRERVKLSKKVAQKRQELQKMK